MKEFSIKERIELPKRGFKILNRYCPGLIRTVVVSEAVSAIQPFVSVWFSAKIINELSGLRRVKAVILYVAGIVLFNFICYVLKNSIKEVRGRKEREMWAWLRKIFADKQMSLDFPDVENADIQHQKQKLYEHIFMFGYGLPQLAFSIPLLVRVLVNITTSVAMIVSLFTSRTGSALIDHPVWIAVLLLVIVLSGYGNYKAVNKSDLLFEKTSRNIAYSNRAFDFFIFKLPTLKTALRSEPRNSSPLAQTARKRINMIFCGHCIQPFLPCWWEYPIWCAICL